MIEFYVEGSMHHKSKSIYTYLHKTSMLSIRKVKVVFIQAIYMSTVGEYIVY